MPALARLILAVALASLVLFGSALSLAAQTQGHASPHESYYAPPGAALAAQIETPPAAAVDQPRGEKSLPLPPPNRRAPASRRGGQPPGASKALATVGSSLAIVLSVFFAVAWMTRRSLPKSATALPGEVIEVLGRAPLAGRQQMHLLRVGNKLVLVSVTPAGAETLAEVTDPVEVDRICGLCRRQRTDSASATFRQVLDQMGAERAPRNFVGESGRDA